LGFSPTNHISAYNRDRKRQPSTPGRQYDDGFGWTCLTTPLKVQLPLITLTRQKKKVELFYMLYILQYVSNSFRSAVKIILAYFAKYVYASTRRTLRNLRPYSGDIILLSTSYYDCNTNFVIRILMLCVLFSLIQFIIQDTSESALFVRRMLTVFYGGKTIFGHMRRTNNVSH